MERLEHLVTVTCAADSGSREVPAAIQARADVGRAIDSGIKPALFADLFLVTRRTLAQKTLAISLAISRPQWALPETEEVTGTEAATTL
jgi:hypothetical protein